MSQKHQINNPSELLRDLSQQEQERLAAGQELNLDFLGKGDFFIQQTNIQTESNNTVTSGEDSNNQNTKYNLSQITIGASFTFGWPVFNSGNQRWNVMSNLLKKLFS